MTGADEIFREGPSRRVFLAGLGGAALAVPYAGHVLGVPRRALSRPRSGTVVDGNARFQVLTPSLVRLEYAGDGAFCDATTFTVTNRDFPEVRFAAYVDGADRVIRTSQMELRYTRGSGPFTPSNTSARVRSSGTTVVATPEWEYPPIVVGSLAEAEAATLTGTGKANDHTGYSGTGFVALSAAGSSIDWSLDSVPSAGGYTVQVRYANSYGAIGGGAKTLTMTVDGQSPTTLTFPMTAGWDDWAVLSQPVTLSAGAHQITLSVGSGDNGNVNIDAMAVTTPGAAFPPLQQPSTRQYLGGWYRDLGGLSGPVALNPGLLTRDGWALLDDSRAPLWEPGDNPPAARPSHDGGYQDGYLFGYGTDYLGALQNLAALVGPAPLLPRWAFGVWFSRYYAYTLADYQDLLARFRAEHLPLDALVIDTDWKAPNQWNGWDWNSSLLPPPRQLLSWAHGENLRVALNIHASIQDTDPNFAAAQATAGGDLIPGSTGNWFDPDPNSREYFWDWSKPEHVRSYFDLHAPYEHDGVDLWWLDYFGSGGSRANVPNLSSDAWINALYSNQLEGRERRGFSLARMGGAWAEHRSTVHFTGDTKPTWDMLAFEAAFTAAEGAGLGLPYVSHDIGSFSGKHLADDLYVRWIQLGTFQPVLRLHSDHGDRLPWDYGQAAEQAAKQFLRLRGALVPYTYSLAWQARQTGAPIVRALYLHYPEVDEAYDHETEYLYGPDLLVAPVTTAGTAADTTVWFPPGTWIDFFTGETHTGPGTETITTDWTRMPVFAKAGAIIVRSGDDADVLQLDVYPQGRSSFTLYEDAGEGLDYQRGAYTTTQLTSSAPAHGAGDITVGITPNGAARHRGRPRERGYELAIRTTTAPNRVRLGRRVLQRSSPGSRRPGWYYDTDAATTHVTTGMHPIETALSITLEDSSIPPHSGRK